MTTPHVVVPCAGFGQRFKDLGYTEEKPLIKVGGKRLIDWVLECLPMAWMSRLIFVIRNDQHRMANELSILGNVGLKILALAGPTQGAACSVLAAAIGIPPDEPVLVMNSDQYFRLGKQKETGVKNMWELHMWAIQNSLDGFILTFPGTGPAWSYAVTNGLNRVVHVIEKKQVSDKATVGVYWWRRAGDLVRSICSMIAVGEKTRGEFYLAPSMNFMPLSDKHVQDVPVEEFHGLGTPEQVRAFEALLQSGWKP